jgi:hypothetical protein
MLWRRSAPPLTVPSVAPVPDAEALRRAALQASWVRGRWVARRRVALRWALWVVTRYLMPALAVFGLMAWLWLGVLPGFHNPLHQLQHWAGLSQAPAATPSVRVAPVSPAPAVPSTASEAALDTSHAVEFSPEGEELPRPLALKFETRWAAVAPPDAVRSTPRPGVEPDSEPSPPLKPENWLHSKEP